MPVPNKWRRLQDTNLRVKSRKKKKCNGLAITLPRYGPAHAVRARKQVRIVAVILDVVIKTKFVGETLQQLPAPTFGD